MIYPLVKKTPINFSFKSFSAMSIQVKLSIHGLSSKASALVHRLKVCHIRKVVLLPNQSTHLDKYLVLTESYTEK